MQTYGYFGNVSDKKTELWEEKRRIHIWISNNLRRSGDTGIGLGTGTWAARIGELTGVDSPELFSDSFESQSVAFFGPVIWWIISFLLINLKFSSGYLSSGYLPVLDSIIRIRELKLYLGKFLCWRDPDTNRIRIRLFQFFYIKNWKLSVFRIWYIKLVKFVVNLRTRYMIP